jgi:hypothetical protein
MSISSLKLFKVAVPLKKVIKQGRPKCLAEHIQVNWVSIVAEN